MSVQITHLTPLSPSSDKSHHLPHNAGFRNPWPSYAAHATSPLALLQVRFSPSRPTFIPVPEDREGIPQVVKPDFTPPAPTRTPNGKPKGTMKVTWIGHASFLIQCSPAPGATRGINILLDPVFSERTSPVTFLGPKRYTPTPCTIQQLCDAVSVDVVCLSHNHYDHSDAATLRYVFERAVSENREMVACVGLRNARWVRPLIPVGREEKVKVWEGDWWERIEMWQGEKNGDVDSSVRITVTPSQHASARSPFDKDHDLWCGFVVEGPPYSASHSTYFGSSKSESSNTSDARGEEVQSSLPQQQTSDESVGAKLFFAGDTAYRSTATLINTKHTPFKPSSRTSTSTSASSTAPQHSHHPPAPTSLESLTPTQRLSYPSCPVFPQIGSLLGPFDLSLLPIGLTKPRAFMSCIHADAWDSVCIHKDVRSKRSLGMHWGTVRGGLSGQYEDVRTPLREWRDAAASEGLRFRGLGMEVGKGGEEGGEVELEDWEIGVVNVGESVVV